MKEPWIPLDPVWFQCRAVMQILPAQSSQHYKAEKSFHVSTGLFDNLKTAVLYYLPKGIGLMLSKEVSITLLTNFNLIVQVPPPRDATVVNSIPGLSTRVLPGMVSLVM